MSAADKSGQKQYPAGRRSRPHQIPHRFVRGIGNPHCGELAGTVSFANITASQRSVLTRWPDFIGISEGATPMQLCPRPVSKRCSPYPQGPAS
jgi:hypothetical protein